MLTGNKNFRKGRWNGASYLAIVVIGLLLALITRLEAVRNYEETWQEHSESARDDARNRAKNIKDAFEQIYQGIRTIGFLPSVRSIDRHGARLGDDGRATIQQVYNNLASNVDISEVYILPADFDPTRIDPITAKPEEPILMFDHLIVNAGQNANTPDPFMSSQLRQSIPGLPEEVEIHEYQQLYQQLAWFRTNVPNQNAITGIQVPMISSDEIITCDNTEFIISGNDADRQGLIFSTPFFGRDGKFKGSISAIILSNSLQKLLPYKNYSIFSPSQVSALASSASTSADTNTNFLAAASLLPQLDMITRQDIVLSAHDPRGNWSLQVNHSAAEYFAGKQYKSIRTLELAAYVLFATMTMVCLGCLIILQRRNAEMRHQANHDDLTQLPNMRMLREVIGERILRSTERSKHAVLFLDLDRFKFVNDTYGHAVGDALLKAVAKRLRNCIDESDTVARIGGDEFVIFQCNLARSENALVLARRIIAAIAEPFEIDGQFITVGTSVGVAMYPADGSDPDTLLRNSDMALFRAKSNGRGSCCFFEPIMDEQLQVRRQLEGDLRRAVAQNELVLHYQPFVDAVTGEITGFEALMRWNHPTRGFMDPAEFIGIAEDTGAINVLGEWAIRQACFDASLWPAPLRVAVNVSAVQFRSYALPLIVVSALEKSGLEPSRLELEITESVLLVDNAMSGNILTQLQALGVRIALDDFGTGYSSLNYLRSFKFDKIKIDRSFVGDLSGLGGDSEVVKAVVALGVSFGMTTTAEGVETEEQLHNVRRQGCDEAQGFYFAKPLAAAEISNLLKDWKSVAA